MSKIKAIFGGGQKAPSVPTVDPEAERRKSEAEAAAKANEELLASARRKREQRGLLASGTGTGGSVLASGEQKAASTVLASAGK